MPKHLSQLIKAQQENPNIWGLPPVEAMPERWLDSWTVIKIVQTNGNEDCFGLHFVGRDRQESNGAVSSKIDRFDPVRMRGVTRSGRVYQLVGGPGFNADAEYVMQNWCRFNQVEPSDATDEFIKQYGISIENIEKLAQ